MDEPHLNTIGYVLSRYGALTGQDLENLTHSEAPWQLADSGRRPGESAGIKLEWIKKYFRTSGSADDSIRHLSRSGCRTLRSDAKAPPDRTAGDELEARLDELRTRLCAAL